MLHYMSYLDYNNFYIQESVSTTDGKAQLIRIVHRKYKLKETTSSDEYFLIVLTKNDEKKCVLHCAFIF
jgi:hypothetical protein